MLSLTPAEVSTHMITVFSSLIFIQLFEVMAYPILVLVNTDSHIYVTLTGDVKDQQLTNMKGGKTNVKKTVMLNRI